MPLHGLRNLLPPALHMLQVGKQNTATVACTVAGYAVCAAEKNPYTGYRDWPMASCAEEMQAAREDFDWYTKENEHKVVPECHPSVVTANQIFQDAVRDIKSRGRKDLSQFEWEVKVMESEDTRTLPGGKVILRAEDTHLDEHELAYVLCHELGHTVARHGMGIAALFTAWSPLLHLSEKKADKIASVLMAHIGYDPRACIGAMSKDPQVSSFTHPHPKERAEALMSSGSYKRAMEIYKTKKGLRKPYLYEGLPEAYLDVLIPSMGPSAFWTSKSPA